MQSISVSAVKGRYCKGSIVKWVRCAAQAEGLWHRRLGR